MKCLFSVIALAMATSLSAGERATGRISTESACCTTTQTVEYVDEVRTRLVDKIIQVEEEYVVSVPVVTESLTTQSTPTRPDFDFSRDVERKLTIGWDSSRKRTLILKILKRRLKDRLGSRSSGKLSSLFTRQSLIARTSPAGPGKEGVAFHPSSRAWAHSHPCYASHPGGCTVTVRGADGWYATRRFGANAHANALAVSTARAQSRIRGHM